MHSGFSSIVWSTTPEEADELQNLTECSFVQKLNDSFRDTAAEFCSQKKGSFLNGVASDIFAAAKVLFPEPTEGDGVPPLVTGLASVRATFPLSIGHIKRYWKNRAVLIGFCLHLSKLQLFLATLLIRSIRWRGKDWTWGLRTRRYCSTV